VHNTRIGHLRVELELTDEMRQRLMELATGNATTVVIPHAMLRHVRLHHCQTLASRIREVQYRHVTVERLELSGATAHSPMHTGLQG